jgi:hypothetical protein
MNQYIYKVRINGEQIVKLTISKEAAPSRKDLQSIYKHIGNIQREAVATAEVLEVIVIKQ